MKKNMWTTVAMGVLLLAACASGGATNDRGAAPAAALESVPTEYAGRTSPLDVESAAAGAEVFRAYCAACHGEQGRGDGPASASLSPRPMNLAELQTRVGDDYLLWRISVGKQGTAMVGWKDSLTEEQIWQAIAFLRSLKK